MTLLVTAYICTGCSLLKGVLQLPDKAIHALLSLNREGITVDPVELQSKLIRFSDHYLDGMNSSIRLLRQNDNEFPDRRFLLKRRIALSGDVLSIATGSNAYANLLDMVILVTLSRISIEDYWMPKRFGDSARNLLAIATDSEKEIWRIAATVLRQEQLEELRRAIAAWRAKNPGGLTPRDVGALGFAAEVAEMNKHAHRDNSSVFNLLLIDPFAGLDPATSELANTRLFAERGLFLARHMPTLIRWESELFTLQTAELPQVENLLASTQQFSTAVDRLSQTGDRLPGLISNEREHLVQALDSQRPGLVNLAEQSEKALNAGKGMSVATDATLQSMQRLVKQLGEMPSDPNAEPFKIADYTKAAAEIHTAAAQLTALLDAFGRTISPEQLDALGARVDLMGQQAQASGKAVVDYAFNKVLLLGSLLTVLMAAVFLLTSWAFLAIRRSMTKPGG